jgi:hypothetical protein
LENGRKEMSDEELCKSLRSTLWGQGHHINIKAADRIEALEQHVADLLADVPCACGYDNPTDVCMKHLPLVRNLTAKLAKAVEALRKLHHAVCGETGFAACVRLDSGLAYPWPALDEADEMTRATLAEIEEAKT